MSETQQYKFNKQIDLTKKKGTRWMSIWHIPQLVWSWLIETLWAMYTGIPSKPHAQLLTTTFTSNICNVSAQGHNNSAMTGQPRATVTPQNIPAMSALKYLVRTRKKEYCGQQKQDPNSLFPTLCFQWWPVSTHAHKPRATCPPFAAAVTLQSLDNE